MDPNLTWYAFSDPEIFGVYVTNYVALWQLVSVVRFACPETVCIGRAVEFVLPVVRTL